MNVVGSGSCAHPAIVVRSSKHRDKSFFIIGMILITFFQFYANLQNKPLERTYKNRKTTDNSKICQSFNTFPPSLSPPTNHVAVSSEACSCCWATHSRGVIPVIDLKVRKNDVSLAKPDWSATEVIFASGCCNSSRFPCSMR